MPRHQLPGTAGISERRLELQGHAVAGRGPRQISLASDDPSAAVYVTSRCSQTGLRWRSIYDLEGGALSGARSQRKEVQG